MKATISKLTFIAFVLLLSGSTNAQDFQGKAYYFSKTTMDMSRFGGRQMSEAQKKQMESRMKTWLEKTYVLTFNQEESIYKEDEKLAAPGGNGRGPSVWGSSFAAGPQYKNVKTKTYLQDQEFFGKQFLIKETMEPLQWKMGSETKKIGQYTCFKATASKPSTEINWTRRNRGGRDNDTTKKADSTKTNEVASTEDKPTEEVEMVDIVAWYSPQIPVSQGPGEYWGLPGLILEVSAGNSTILCNKIVMNPQEKTKIEAPEKGKVVTKKEYNTIITEKMQEMRDNRGRGNGRNRNF